MNLRTLALSLMVVASMANIAYGQAQSPTPSAPQTPANPPTRIRVGGPVQSAKIVHQVTPIYPADAKAAHVSGTVVLHGSISKDGSIQQLESISGPPLLLQAAMDAVKQWHYQPTTLSGNPVEVDTTIQVVFTLSDTSPSESQEVDPQLKADIVHLFDVMHLQERTMDMGRTAFASLRPAILASLPLTPNREKIADAYQEKLVGLFTSQEFIDRTVPPLREVFLG